MTGSTSTPRPGCPPWCSDHPCTSVTGFHISKGESAILRTSPDPAAEHNGYLHAYAALDPTTGHGVALALYSEAARGTDVSGPMTFGAAELVARLAELLAGTTPETHREAAAAIRRAAGIARGGR